MLQFLSDSENLYIDVQGYILKNATSPPPEGAAAQEHATRGTSKQRLHELNY